MSKKIFKGGKFNKLIKCKIVRNIGAFFWTHYEEHAEAANYNYVGFSIFLPIVLKGSRKKKFFSVSSTIF